MWGTMGFSDAFIRQLRCWVGLSASKIIGLPFKSSGW